LLPQSISLFPDSLLVQRLPHIGRLSTSIAFVQLIFSIIVCFPSFIGCMLRAFQTENSAGKTTSTTISAEPTPPTIGVSMRFITSAPAPLL